MKQKLLLFLAVLGFFTTVAYAQSIVVNGVVVDAGSGDPIIGATVLAESNETGTITDFDGNFTLSVAEGEMLHFTYVGYKDVVLQQRQLCRCK